jgi:LmbE family N-acetylglucosaminyl deacetylase
MTRRLLVGIAGAIVLLLSDVAISQVQSDSFKFSDGGSQAINVPLSGKSGAAEITWPESAGADWDTALLGVTVIAEPGARSPYIEVGSGIVSERQHFSAGDNGPRWLNLSFLRGTLKGGARITLRVDGIALSGDQTTLRLFASHPDFSKSILVLAPHPDDAEIGTFGVYAHRKATVVTVTSGNAGEPTYESVFNDIPELYRFKGHIRVIDSITVPWQGGIPPDRTFNMGYFDGRLAEMHDKPDQVIPEVYSTNTDLAVYLTDNIGSLLPKKSRASTWPNLVADLETLLKKVKPAVILAPHPQLDSHRDHQFTTIALAEAMARWKKPVTLLLYTNHADGGRYPYGPAGTAMSLPPPPAGREVLLDRIYSHPLTADLQRLKLFALESMHDLRYNPTRQYQLAVDDERTSRSEKHGPEPDITYLRRGPRSNELFYVYDQDSVKPMTNKFLSDRGNR